jgi:hypothetical protein
LIKNLDLNGITKLSRAEFISAITGFNPVSCLDEIEASISDSVKLAFLVEKLFLFVDLDNNGTLEPKEIEFWVEQREKRKL